MKEKYLGIIWWGVLLTTAFAAIFSYISRPVGVKWVAITLLLFAMSLMIFHAYIFERTMHLSGFELDVRKKALRILFLVFAIVIWISSFIFLLFP